MLRILKLLVIMKILVIATSAVFGLLLVMFNIPKPVASAIPVEIIGFDNIRKVILAFLIMFELYLEIDLICTFKLAKSYIHPSEDT